ncbi:MAG: copper chaperone PCu(A)C [Methylovirgula sp.]
MHKFHHQRIAFALFLATALFSGAAALSGAAAIEAHGLKIEGAWVRETPPSAKVGAGFLTIVNTTKAPDRLVGASAPAAAAKVELHETIMSDNVARMRPLVGGLAIPAGATVTLKPGSYHIMFVGLKAPFVKGERIKATLDFEKAGKVSVEFDVRGVGAGAPQDMHMH